MGDRAKRVLGGIVRSLGYGALTAVALGVFTFLFAFLTGGFDWVLGCEWVERLLYVAGSVGIIAGGVGMLFSGREYEEKGAGFTAPVDDPVDLRGIGNKMTQAAGISWPWALVVASCAVMAVATLFDVFYLRVLL